MKKKLEYVGQHQPQGVYEVEESAVYDLIATGSWRRPTEDAPKDDQMKKNKKKTVEE